MNLTLRQQVLSALLLICHVVIGVFCQNFNYNVAENSSYVLIEVSRE